MGSLKKRLTNDGAHDIHLFLYCRGCGCKTHIVGLNEGGTHLVVKCSRCGLRNHFMLDTPLHMSCDCCRRKGMGPN